MVRRNEQQLRETPPEIQRARRGETARGVAGVRPDPRGRSHRGRRARHAAGEGSSGLHTGFTRVRDRTHKANTEKMARF